MVQARIQNGDSKDIEASASILVTTFLLESRLAGLRRESRSLLAGVFLQAGWRESHEDTRFLCVPLRPRWLVLFKPINQPQRTQSYAEGSCVFVALSPNPALEEPPRSDPFS